ncbi:MAG: hypothetical protein CSA42_02270 [Gammaproteobacteria bacterium]|nr:MAG: hypothetical protein CSA42_02270 [Gammaproteobacteria bacterium]
MKLFTKSVVLAASLGMATVAMAADPIVGNYQTYENGQPKATVKITQSGSTFTGKIIAGNTAKAKQYIGRTVIKGLKAKGGGKYSGGKITDPVSGKTYRLSATKSGNTLKLRGYMGVEALGRTQTWKKK